MTVVVLTLVVIAKKSHTAKIEVCAALLAVR